MCKETSSAHPIRPIVHTVKRKRETSPTQQTTPYSWREALGNPPPFGNTKVRVYFKIQGVLNIKLENQLPVFNLNLNC